MGNYYPQNQVILQELIMRIYWRINFGKHAFMTSFDLAKLLLLSKYIDNNMVISQQIDLIMIMS